MKSTSPTISDLLLIPTLSTRAHKFLTDPLLPDLSPTTSLQDVELLVAYEKGEAIKLFVRVPIVSEPLSVITRPASTFQDLKPLIQKAVLKYWDARPHPRICWKRFWTGVEVRVFSETGVRRVEGHERVGVWVKEGGRVEVGRRVKEPKLRGRGRGFGVRARGR